MRAFYIGKDPPCDVVHFAYLITTEVVTSSMYLVKLLYLYNENVFVFYFYFFLKKLVKTLHVSNVCLNSLPSQDLT